MRGKRDVGMRGGDGGIEDRAEEGASVSHRLASWDLRWKHATPVIHPIQAKENPRSALRGFLREPRRAATRDGEASAADVAADDLAEQIPFLSLEFHQLKLGDRSEVFG